MSRRKKKPKVEARPMIATPRPEEIAFLKRWNNARSAPSLWEKKERDIVYAAALENRPEGSLGKSWGIRKSYRRSYQ